MTTFYHLLTNTLLAATTNNFLWFAITFWIYLETKSVLASSVVGGSYMLISSLFGLAFGSYVDHHRKKTAMLTSSLLSLSAFGAASVLFALTPKAGLLTLRGWEFWLFVLLALFGAVAGNLRGIAMSTTVTLLVPVERRDRANGLVSTTNGIGFAITSVFSGLAVGQLGMGWCLAISVGLTAVATAHILAVPVKEEQPLHSDEHPKKVDIKGTLRVIRLVPGLMALILFTTFNNFLGGVFMSLMDPYGLSLVSVEVWGFLWGALSFAYILGGLAVARRGLGSSPLRALFLSNVAMWVATVLFPMRSSIALLVLGMLVYMILFPFVEAAEQTIIQKVVPFERQGRVFGFAQTVETAASPITAFLIGPIAQFWVMPYMTTGGGSEAIGGWFGTGPDRAMALIFIVSGIVGLIVTLLAMASPSYRLLNQHYGIEREDPEPAPSAS